MLISADYSQCYFKLVEMLHYTDFILLGILCLIKTFVCHRFTFCAHDKTQISPGESVSFGKCRDGWEVKPKKRCSLVYLFYS